MRDADSFWLSCASLQQQSTHVVDKDLKGTEVKMMYAKSLRDACGGSGMSESSPETPIGCEVSASNDMLSIRTCIGQSLAIASLEIVVAS